MILLLIITLVLYGFSFVFGLATGLTDYQFEKILESSKPFDAPAKKVFFTFGLGYYFGYKFLTWFLGVKQKT